MINNDYLKVYDENYYKNYINGQGYDSPILQKFLFDVANIIATGFHFSTVLDVGCAYGTIVSVLRQYGISAYGADASEFAVSKVAKCDKNFVAISKLPELVLPASFPRKFDFLTCIEVLEHIPKKEAEASIKRLTELSDLILFSSSPDAYYDPTHLNIQPQCYWKYLFHKCGFEVCENIDASFVSKHALVFEKVN